MIIGLAGYAGSGKDTAGKILVDRGYTRLAFADKLKELAIKIDPNVWDNEDEVDVPLSWYVTKWGWDDAKKSDEVRGLLQRLGAGVREILGDNTWVAPIEETLYDKPHLDYVITDVRYPNEIQSVHDYGGVVWWIDRPGVGPVNDHESEASIKVGDCDLYVLNDKTVDDLRAKINLALEVSTSVVSMSG
ncbi:hypothetical protein ACFQS3_02360 [Glycomyces mayteni]|uniref:DNMP kinase n=1 Tax=Glycomyces mayteni TaxID=543887 RepID=A0ABW2D4I2_9ACTN|nr:hypothetical protein GCM10025732_47690 [Glycomyces mayteni]